MWRNLVSLLLVLAMAGNAAAFDLWAGTGLYGGGYSAPLSFNSLLFYMASAETGTLTHTRAATALTTQGDGTAVRLATDTPAFPDLRKLGPEMFTPYALANPSAVWASNGASFSGNLIQINSGAQSGTYSQAAPFKQQLQIGKTYQIQYEISNYVSGQMAPMMGTLATTPHSGNGTYTEIATQTGNTYFAMYTVGAAQMSVRPISLREVEPVWSTKTRPFMNLFWDSENLAAASWTKGTGTSTPVQNAIAPDGTTTAWSVTISSAGVGLYGAQPLSMSSLYRQGWWIRAKSGTPKIYMSYGGAYPNRLITLSTTWQWYDGYSSQTVSGVTPGLRLDYPTNLGGTVDIEVWHPVLYEVDSRLNMNIGSVYAQGNTTLWDNSYDANPITCWGDSMTINLYPDVLVSLLNHGVRNFGVGGETSIQIMTRFNAGSQYYPETTILWMGHNNSNTAGDVTQVKADIAAATAALGHNRFLVLTIADSRYIAGSAEYNYKKQINDWILATYPNNSFDARAFLVSQYNNPRVIQTAQGITDHNNDIVSTDLRSDAIHLTPLGYELLAEQLATILTSRGWVFDSATPVNYGKGLLSHPTGSISTSPTVISSTPAKPYTAGKKWTVSGKYTPLSYPGGDNVLWSSYVDANNYTAYLLNGTSAIFRRRVSGSNIDTTVTIPTPVVGTQYQWSFTIFSNGSTSAVWNGLTASSAVTTPPQLAANSAFQLGSLNSIGQVYGQFQSIKVK